MLEHTSSQEERTQIVQTIEMFEVIIQTQPDDYQSLEILKEAYAKLGRDDDSRKTSRRLAEAYFNVGSYALAMQECELILQLEPNAPEILAMLGDIETRMHGSNGANATEGGATNGLIAAAPVSQGIRAGEGSLIDVQAGAASQGPRDRGDEQLAKFLVMQQLFSEEAIESALDAVKSANKDLDGQALATSLIDRLCGADNAKLEAVLSALIDRTKFAYVPLEYYDADRQIARMLQDNLTLGRLFVPFDLVSRTIMVACCNPFDAAGRDAVQQSLDYTITWYLARPNAIIKSLQDIYRLESRT